MEEIDMAIFKGAGVAIVTPMKENQEVNYEKLEELIEFQIENGTDCIVIAGTTGESSTLSMEEHKKVIEAAIAFTKGRIPVVAGTGSNCTATAVQLSQEAEEAGADGLLIVTPYYNKATQGGLIRHYTTIARSVKTPIIMYNVPSRTGCNILPETAATLFKNETNIVGLKEATGSLAQASKTMDLTDGKLDLYSGEDGLVVPLMSIGAIGVISVWSNVAPKDVNDMCNLSQGIKEQAYVEGTENGIAIGKQEGITIGKQEGIAETIIKMYRKGYEPAQISDLLDMELDEIQEIIENE